MPVQALTTSAISSGPTSCRKSRRPAGFSPPPLALGRFRLQPPAQLLPLHFQFVKLLEIALGHAAAGGLLLLDRGAQLVVLAIDVGQLLADLVDVAEAGLFAFPLLAKVGQLAAQLGHLLLDFGAALLRVLLGLLGQLAIGQLQLHQPPLHRVDLVRHALQLHRQAAGRLVHQVDGLVGEEAVGDVAMREVGRGHQGRVLDLDPLVMGFVAGLQAAENGDRVFDARLADYDRLKAPLQGGVLFHVFAIFVQRRGADAAEFAAGQGGLEQVGGVGAPFRPARADDRVQLVDEEDDVRRVGDLAEHGLEALLELAAELRPRHQRPHVQGDDALVFQAFGHVGVDDPQGQSLGDGRLAHARLADQHGVVLRPPGEHLDDAADFLVAADHGIELALPRPLDQVDAVSLQGLELRLRVLIGHPRAAADRLKGLEHFLVADGVELEDVFGLRVDLGHRQEEVFDGDELVLHRVGLALGGLEHAVQFLAQLAAGRRRKPSEDGPIRTRQCGPTGRD